MASRARPQTLFWVVAAALLAAALLGALLQSLVAVAVLRPLEARELRARAELAASRFAAGYASLPAPADSARVQELIARVRRESELRVPVIFRGDDGRVIGDRPDRAREALAEALRPAAERGEDGRPPRLRVLLSQPVRRADGEGGHLLVLHSARPRRGMLGGNAFLLSLPIAVLTSLLVALVLVRLLVRRLRTLERFADRVAEDDLSARVEDTRGDEIGRLGEQFNRMAERLTAARERLAREEGQRRQLFADITHELATPLTSIRGYTETMLDPSIQVSSEEHARYLRGMLEETRRLDRLIRDLFDLARLEAGASPLEREPLDWVALARNVAARFEPRFAAAGLALAWGETPREAWIEADGHRVEQVIENLLKNALRYVPRGGTVSLAMAPVTLAGGRAAFRLTVADDGPGAPPEEVARLFERFYRAAGARPNGAGGEIEGSGLGLAIVREIVQRHGGAARAAARVPHGLTIEIELPARGAA